MKVIIAGDFYPNGKTNRVINDIKDYNAVLGEVRSLLKSTDYSIVNYESPVITGREVPITKCGPNLCSTSICMEAVKWAGFRMVTLANNHILDYGVDGIRNTVSVCQFLDIDVVGVGENLEDASKVFYKIVENKVLAIINCCEHEFSIATENSIGANPLNPIRQYYQIQEACKHADYVLIIVHGGHEQFQLPSPRMVETYRFFIEAGADAVVNHHQHCFSGYEVYKSKPIFYGIGNFCFEEDGMVNKPWNEGYMVELNFGDRISFTLYPYLQCNGNVSIEILKETTAFTKKIEKLNNIVANPKMLEQVCADFYDKSGKYALNIFEPYNGKYLQAAFYKGLLPSFFRGKKRSFALNQIMCEAHRDRILYVMNKTLKNLR